MGYYRIGICDDENIILEELYFSIYNIIKDIFFESECDFEIKKYNNPNDLINSHFTNNFDIIFLDIDMPKINGIEVARTIKTNSKRTLIIFITNKEELVFETFKIQAFRFIRKSKLSGELEESITSAIKLFEIDAFKINFKIENNNYEIDINNILYIESDRNYITIYTINNKKYRFKDSINQKEKQLDKYGFIRTHLGYLVNQKYIQRINNDSVVLVNSEKIPLSRARIQFVQQKLIEYLR